MSGIQMGRRTMSQPFMVCDNFLKPELAQAMRADIEAHFAEPMKHTPQTHQVWNYWYVPELYTYMRTLPEKVIQRDKVERFVNALRGWSALNLGLGNVSWPFLSLYVTGCRQGLHNDSKNGRFAFVYSLTKNDRKSSGGETIVVREGDLFRDNVANANAGPGFFTAIEPRFNRLVVFDDRMPHGVERVDGAMDPVEGRFVFHGHISDSGPMVVGGLALPQIQETLVGALAGFLDEAYARARLYHGPFVLRLDVGTDGKVTSCYPILDRVVATDRGDVAWESMRAKLVERFEALTFPEAPEISVILQPILFEATLYRPKM